MDIVFATGNAHKATEAGNALGKSFTLIMPKDLGITEEIPENGDTLEVNALEKAQYLWNKLGKNCFADDTGLEVDALGGAPGVYSARYAGPSKGSEANIEKLLAELDAASERNGAPVKRTARFRTVIALIMDGKVTTFEEICEGEIACQKRGDQGFGYDPVFLPCECNGKSMAELTLEEKNAISHRGKAMRKLSEYLNSCIK